MIKTERIFERIKAVWGIREEWKLLKLTDRVVIQGNKVGIMYVFQQSINMNANSVIINVKPYVLLTLVDSLCHAWKLCQLIFLRRQRLGLKNYKMPE